jgi:hypothetical protein
MPETIKPKLCKFREVDVANIETVKRLHGFHEDMTAIRYALHLAAVAPAGGLGVEKNPTKNKKNA